MNEEKEVVEIHDGVKFFEDDICRIEFHFKSGFISDIKIIVKDDDIIKPVNLADKRLVAGWLSGAHKMVINILSSSPSPKAPISPPPRMEDHIAVISGGNEGPPLCPTCNVLLIEKESCCSGTAVIHQCPTCGVRVKVRSK